MALSYVFFVTGILGKMQYTALQTEELEKLVTEVCDVCEFGY